jgi:hypothetical protein
MFAKFAECVNSLGGALVPERLSPAEHLIHRSVVDFIEDDIRVWKETMIDFELVWVHNPALLGFADVDGDSYKIALSYGTGLALLELFYFLLANPLFKGSDSHAAQESPAIGLPPRAIGLIAQEVHTGHIVARPRSAERRTHAQSLTKTALLFLFYHEIAHVIRGHTDYARSSGFGPLRDHPIEQKPMANFPIRLTLENDADAVATDFLLTVRSVDLFSRKDERRGSALRDFFIAIGSLFAVMDSAKFSDENYPAPLHRFFNVLDHAAPSAEKHLGISIETTRSCAKEAILELQKGAELLRLPSGRWSHPTAQEWQTDLYEQKKQEWRDQMKSLLAGRSTISDEVLKRLRP